MTARSASRSAEGELGRAKAAARERRSALANQAALRATGGGRSFPRIEGALRQPAGGALPEGGSRRRGLPEPVRRTRGSSGNSAAWRHGARPPAALKAPWAPGTGRGWRAGPSADTGPSAGIAPHRGAQAPAGALVSPRPRLCPALSGQPGPGDSPGDGAGVGPWRSSGPGRCVFGSLPLRAPAARLCARGRARKLKRKKTPEPGSLRSRRGRRQRFP